MIFLLANWKYIAAALLAALIGWQIHAYGAREYKAGAASVIAADAKAAAKQQAEWDAKELKYREQLGEAANEHAANLTELERLRNQPQPHVVCHVAPSASSLPAVPAAPADSAAGTGALPQASPAEFDPTDRLLAAADAADDLVEACRDALNKWPK